MNAPVPVMERYARHVMVCTGGFCSESKSGRAIYSRLASLLQREGLLFGPTRVKRSEAPCLGVCGGGPIVVVYPEGVWYAQVTPTLLERIVVEHLRDGRVIDEAVFHRLAAPDVLRAPLAAPPVTLAVSANSSADDQASAR